MKGRLKEFLLLSLSLWLVFISGGISAMLDHFEVNPFMELLWIPFFIAGCFLNIKLLKKEKKKWKKD